jgi:hypothetical protein
MDTMILKACEQWFLKASSLWWTLATSPLNLLLFLLQVLQSMMNLGLFYLQLLSIGPDPVTFVFKPSSTEFSHLTAGLPSCRVRVNFLQGFCPCILKRCPSHLNHPALSTGGLQLCRIGLSV